MHDNDEEEALRNVLHPPLPPKPDMVRHPAHYNNHPSGVECLTIVRHMSFNLGSAMKCIWRVDGKGDPIENLEKAIYHIRDEIERRKAHG